MLDHQQLIDTLTEDARRDLAEYERALTIGGGRSIDLAAHRLMGSRVALGRALAWRDDLPAEGVVTAFARGRDFQDTLTAA